jgi:hypothetical protein
VEKERVAFREAGQKKVDALRKQWDEKIEALMAKSQQRIQDLKSQLKGKHQVKPQAQQSEFPAYTAAKRKGYRDGEKPSQSEMDMTPDERRQAMFMLMR